MTVCPAPIYFAHIHLAEFFARPEWSLGTPKNTARAHKRGYSDTRHCQNFSSDTRHWGQKMPDTRLSKFTPTPDTQLYKDQSSRKLFQVYRTICPARLQCSVGHFHPHARHFSQLINGKYWILLDKMSGNVRALCRTSAELCRTCPACPTYFARTDKDLIRERIFENLTVQYER